MEENIIILTQEEWNNEKNNIEVEDDFYEQDFEDDIDEVEYSDELKANKKKRIPKKTKDIYDEFGHRIDYSMISEKVDLIAVRNDTYMTQEYSFVANSRLYKGGKTIPDSSENIGIDEIFIGHLDSLLNDKLIGSMYQDGIKLPIRAWTIAPIGSCFALANFFGNARFELNVTRNAINESHVLLGNWASNIGNKIQRKILSEVQQFFDSNKIKYSDTNLITYTNLVESESDFVEFDLSKPDLDRPDLDKSDTVYEYSIAVLESMLRDN